MRFITEAHSVHPYFLGKSGHWPVNMPPPDGCIFVYDTDKRASERIEVQDWSYDDYMGIFKSKTCCGLIMMSLKEAKLHDYITEISFRRCKPEKVLDDEDLVVVRPVMVAKDIIKKPALALDFYGVRIEPLGVNNSVMAFSKESGSIGEFVSLYQLIEDLCEQTGVCLLSYERLRVYSETRRCELVIRFSRTTEAKRFLSKMALDIYR